MLPLNLTSLSSINRSSNLHLPLPQQTDYPEKVLQFGTGVLLRALPDQYIDDANRNGKFCGKIVVVKSTGVGSVDAFHAQQGLYTLCIKGIKERKMVDQTYVNASISRVLSAFEEWDEVLKVAENPSLQLVISNTTEVGIVDSDDTVHTTAAPGTFPGKLLALLFHRFKVFKADPEKGLVIVPTELIEHNGDKLREVLLSLANKNQLGKEFIHWFLASNPVCNSLVDRIVPGRLASSAQLEKETELGYSDPLMIMAEPFKVWAIESSNKKVSEVLSFTDPDQGCFVVADISKYKEKKLRLLNGSHTLCCGVALLAGNTFLRESMVDPQMGPFIKQLVVDEIASLVAASGIPSEECNGFADAVVDRFSNPFIDHKWSSISAQFTSKMKMRNVPLIEAAAKNRGEIPKRITIGFAAYLVCMDTHLNQQGQYIVQHASEPFSLTDEFAPAIHQIWHNKSPREAVPSIMSSTHIWGTDLTQIPGFVSSVTEVCERISVSGVAGLF